MAQFKPGQSGNPAGKPRGSRSKWTKLRESVAKHVPEILDKLVSQAKEGDTQAAKLVLERALPALRPVDAPVRLALGANLAEDGNAVVEALSASRVTPNEAETVMRVLVGQARLTEAAELEMRIKALEEKANAQAAN